MSETMVRINKASRRLSAICLIAFWAAPVLLALFWALAPHVPPMTRYLPAPVNPEHPTVVLILGFFASMIPGTVTMYGFLQLRRLFRLYQAGQVFETANVKCYRRLGWTMVVFAAASFIVEPILGVILTYYNPPGTRLLVLSISSSEIMNLLVGSVILTIAWVMDEARIMKQDYELIV